MDPIRYKFFDMPKWAEELMRNEAWYNRLFNILKNQQYAGDRSRYITAVQCGVDFSKVCRSDTAYLDVIDNDLWVFITVTPEVTMAILGA